MKRFAFLLTLFATTLLLFCGSKHSGHDMSSPFPGLIDGYSITDTASYNPETIFDYIDGAGEVYLSYGFRSLLVANYAQSDRPEITAEIFEMGSSEDGFGVFSFSRESEETGIGNGFEFRGSLLKFWKGKYYVSIQSIEIDSPQRQTFLNLAKHIDSMLTSDGEKPSLLKFCPPEDLILNSEIYFHLFPILNNIYFLADTNILELDKSTDALLARYQPGSTYLLIIDYKEPARAKSVQGKFLKQYLKDSSGVVQTENGKWTGCVTTKNFMIAVFDAPTREYLTELLENSKNLIPL